MMADAMKKALMLNGFTLYDNGVFPELERTEMNVKVFDNPNAIKKPILLEEGQYELRTQLLPFALPQMNSGQEIFAAACGKVFDGSDALHPSHMLLEGVIASELTFFDISVLWRKIIKHTFGAAYDVELIRINDNDVHHQDLSSWGVNALEETSLGETSTWKIFVKEPEGGSFTLGYTGTMTWIGASLLGRSTQQNRIYAFSIDVDHAACRSYGFADRAELYRNTQESFEDGTVSATEAFEDRCRDVLRTMGYTEGFGPRIYPKGIYKKMNMIQDEWDLNNRGVLLKEELGDGVGLPTVLTPALEQIMAEKWKAGEKNVRVFEVSHIFMPRQGDSPVEKLALSFGAYGEGMDLAAFTEDVGDFLTKIGNKNHFYIPTNLAIAYKPGECRLLLDEKMQYLGGNFGGINPIAEGNYGIGIHAYMANLELLPLQNKAEEEYGYIAPELR